MKLNSNHVMLGRQVERGSNFLGGRIVDWIYEECISILIFTITYGTLVSRNKLRRGTGLST
jgi:hypothetical protein